MTKILHFADVHFGLEDEMALKAIETVNEAADPDVTVISGDITQAGKKMEFVNAQAWIAGLKGPVVLTPGNHDTPMFGIFHRLTDPFGRYRKYLEPISETCYQGDTVAIFSYNTSRGWQPGLDWSIGAVDLDDLQSQIEEMLKIADGRHLIVSCHHPMVYPPESPLQKETRNGPEALKMMSDMGVDMVLSGHVHIPFVADRIPGKTELISVGAGTLSTRQRGKNAGFNVLNIEENTVKVSSFEFDGEVYGVVGEFETEFLDKSTLAKIHDLEPVPQQDLEPVASPTLP